MFESNQGGIETVWDDDEGTIADRVWIEPRWDWNNPPVKLTLNWLLVWIEPRWDWNIFIPQIITAWFNVWIEPRWDWNTLNTVPRHPFHSVWIEPRWDWNGSQPIPNRLKTNVWIEPRWDWNTASLGVFTAICFCLNRTTVGLKLKFFILLLSGHDTA